MVILHNPAGSWVAVKFCMLCLVNLTAWGHINADCYLSGPESFDVRYYTGPGRVSIRPLLVYEQTNDPGTAA